MAKMTIEDKLGLNKFNTNELNSHIDVDKEYLDKQEVERVCRAYRRAGAVDVRMKLYHGLRHEILNEKSRRFVCRDVLDWLEERLPPAVPRLSAS